MEFEVSLIGVKKTVQPGKELLCAVISVQNDGNAVRWCNGTDVMGSGNTSGDGSLLFAIGDTLNTPISLLTLIVRDLLLTYLSSKVRSTTL